MARLEYSMVRAMFLSAAVLCGAGFNSVRAQEKPLRDGGRSSAGGLRCRRRSCVRRVAPGKVAARRARASPPWRSGRTRVSRRSLAPPWSRPPWSRRRQFPARATFPHRAHWYRGRATWSCRTGFRARDPRRVEAIRRASGDEGGEAQAARSAGHQASRADFRELHLTAIQTPSRSLGRTLCDVPRSCRVCRRLHSRSARLRRCVAATFRTGDQRSDDAARAKERGDSVCEGTQSLRCRW